MTDNTRYALTVLWNISIFVMFIYVIEWHDWSMWWMIVPLVLFQGKSGEK